MNTPKKEVKIENGMVLKHGKNKDLEVVTKNMNPSCLLVPLIEDEQTHIKKKEGNKRQDTGWVW